MATPAILRSSAMLRSAVPLLGLLALALPAEAGDHRMTVTGTILVTVPSPLPGALGSTFTTGAPFEIVAEVDDNPTVLAPNSYEYPLDTAAGGLAVNGAQLPFTPDFGTIVIADASVAGGDLIILSAEVQTAAAPMACGVSLADPTMTALSSPRIGDLDGVSFTSVPGQPLGMSGGLQSAGGTQSAQVVFLVTEIRFDGTGSGGQGIGTPYCTAVPNSSGSAGECRAFGSNAVANDDVTLEASQLPPNVFGFFLASRTQGFVANPGGSEGNLCLGGTIGRFVGPGEVMNAGPGGAFSLGIDLNAVPEGLVAVAVQPGETWNFAAWHRDVVAGSQTSNFTSGVAVAFQ